MKASAICRRDAGMVSAEAISVEERQAHNMETRSNLGCSRVPPCVILAKTPQYGRAHEAINRSYEQDERFLLSKRWREFYSGYPECVIASVMLTVLYKTMSNIS